MPREAQPLNPAELAAPILPVSALNLPDPLPGHLEWMLRLIAQSEGALRDSHEQHAQGFTEGLRVAKTINRAEAEALQRIIAGTAQAARVAQQGVPEVVLPRCQVEGDELVIRIATDTLLHAVSMSDQWPVDYKGESLATVTNRPLFVQEIINELLREDEQGATPLHLLFDQAAEDALNAGSEAVEIREEDDE